MLSCGGRRRASRGTCSSRLSVAINISRARVVPPKKACERLGFGPRAGWHANSLCAKPSVVAWVRLAYLAMARRRRIREERAGARAGFINGRGCERRGRVEETRARRDRLRGRGPRVLRVLR